MLVPVPGHRGGHLLHGQCQPCSGHMAAIALPGLRAGRLLPSTVQQEAREVGIRGPGLDLARDRMQCTFFWEPEPF